jgi:hypothetical protein
VRDGTLVMTEEYFDVFCEQIRRNVYKTLGDNNDDNNGDALEQYHLQEAELRTL